ncbi:DUF2523 family protein [Pseudomonas aeruginosa]|uniref:DUF2523 family protein n=1 Tax=Pseudomonas aeruginosa TaxID=287 RepID=UPI00283AA957|nr:DUF2523 family protein [Pseudomonas aeruginosa]WMU51305.1 DUF2523 family protein [Pseudomonas aeruginosa]
MPLLIGVLLRAIGWSLIPLGWKLLRGLGFTAVAFVGVKAVMDQAKDYVFSNLGGRACAVASSPGASAS